MDKRLAIHGGPPVRTALPDWPLKDPEIERVLLDAFQDGSWGRYHGPNNPALQEFLSGMFQLEHVQLVSSGTVAIELALRGVGVTAGDEVILSAYDFKANFQNILLLDAIPILVDVRADDGQLDLDQIEEARSPRTKALIATHLHGGIVDMIRLQEWSREHGIPVIEDACQAHGAWIGPNRAGAWGDIGVLSFGGSKLVTAGRGGAILTNRADHYQRIKLYTQRGNDAYPLSELQARLILPQLEKLDVRHRHRQNAAERLSTLWGEGLSPLKVQPANSPAFYKLGLRYDPSKFAGLPPHDFARTVRAEGIPLDTGFPALHETHSKKRFRAASSLEEASRLAASILVLHHPILLEGDSALLDIQTAIQKVRESN